MVPHERRKFERWNISTRAKIRLRGAVADIDCVIHDINFYGAKISSKRRLSVDTCLDLKIALSDEYVLDVGAWVAWHKAIEKINIYAVYFSRISDSDKKKIYKFVYKNSPKELHKQQKSEIIEKDKGGDTVEDRRIFERRQVGMPMRFFNLDTGQEGQADTFDISAKGVGFTTAEELGPRTPLEIWIQVPDRGEPLYSRGEVVWSKAEEAGNYRVGFSLEKADLMGLGRVLRAAA
jgi:hypothetical protein